MIKLVPKCMTIDDKKEYRQQAAVTNRGYLIPCCWLDDEKTLEDPIMKKLLKVSKISEVNDIEEIVLSKEWIQFAKDLHEENFDKILPSCIHHCKKREEHDKIKKETYYDSEGKSEHKIVV